MPQVVFLGMVMKYQCKFLVGALALAVSGEILAAQSWGLVSPTLPGGVTNIQAYSNTGGTDNTANAAENAKLQTIQNATWYGQSDGWGGIRNADACTGTSTACANYDWSEVDAPEHAIDNNQRYDMVLVSFDSKVNLQSLTMSYRNNDSDFTVMAYTGSAVDTAGVKASLVGSTYSALTGWTVVGNYNGADLGSGVTNTTSTTYSISSTVKTLSSWWLIGAYNPLVGGPTQAGVDHGSAANYDHFKLASVYGCKSTETGCGGGGSSVPEPGSMALLAVGLLGLVRVRKARLG